METVLQLVLANALLATLLAGGVYVIGKWLRHPPLVHALWVIVLLKFVTPPVVDWTLPMPDFFRTGPADSAPATGVIVVPDSAGSFLPAPAPAATPGELISAIPTRDLNESHTIGLAEACRGVLSSLPIIWLLGSLTCLGLYWRRRGQLRRLVRLARPAPEAWQRQAEALAARLGLRRCPTVCALPGRVPPMVVFGFGGPRIVLPSELVGSLGANRRGALLLHELAHLHRGDHWARRLEMVVRILYWWYPPVGWIGRQLRVSEEQCCDSLVVTTLPEDRREYAAVLLDTVDFVGAALSSRAYREALAMSSFCTLRRRVTMVLRDSLSARLSPRMLLTVAGLALLVLPFGLTFAHAAEQDAKKAPPPATEAIKGGATQSKTCKRTAKGDAETVRADSSVLQLRQANQRIEMLVNSRCVIESEQKIAEVQVNNPEIVELAPLSPNQIQVLARKAGATQVNVRGKNKHLHSVDIVVHAKPPVPSALAVPPPVQYVIRARMIRTSANRQEKVISEPTLITIEGCKAILHVGGEVQRPVPLNEGEAAEFVTYGNSFEVTISDRKGKIFLDGTYRNTVVQEANRNGVRLTTKETRMIQSIKLGKKVTIRLPGVDDGGARTRLEIVVEKVAPGSLPRVKASGPREIPFVSEVPLIGDRLRFR